MAFGRDHRQDGKEAGTDWDRHVAKMLGWSANDLAHKREKAKRFLALLDQGRVKEAVRGSSTP